MQKSGSILGNLLEEETEHGSERAMCSTLYVMYRKVVKGSPVDVMLGPIFIHRLLLKREGVS